jgi:hypothetical protein
MLVLWSVAAAALSIMCVFGYRLASSSVSFSLVLSTPLFVYAVIMPSLAIGLSLCVGILSNPMHALLSLVGAFLASAAFYLNSGILFIGIVFVIV